MVTQWVRGDAVTATRRWGWTSALVASFLLWGVVAPLHAQDPPRVTLGAGLQTSFLHHQPSGDDAESTDSFRLNSLRFYVNGSATDNIKFMVNTDISYGGSLGAPDSDQNTDVQILDAVAQFEISDKFNVWVGRFLPPSDRANLYGPYYAHHWAVYADGVQDGYPFVFQGRDNGAMYWGQFGKFKVSLGAFDGATATGDSSVITAGRVQVDFWDPEVGYYLNGTYYGDKNILAIGAASQVQSGGETRVLENTTFTEVTTKNASSVDFLLERMVPGGGAVSLEAEWARYDGLGGYPTAPGATFQTLDGGYFLAAYLFPQMVGPGRFELLGKYAHAQYSNDRSLLFEDFDQKTTEVDFNYIMNQFNARMMIFFKNTDYSAVRVDDFQVGVALQIQM